MLHDKPFVFSIRMLLLPLLFVVSMWLVYWWDWNSFVSFYQFGIYPRTGIGLRGILFSPFIHGSLKHLYNNSIPVFALLLALQYFYPKQAWRVLLWGVLLSGLGTWLIGRESHHVGASGLVYVLVSFIFFKGIQTRYYRLVALSLAVVVVYGGMVWYMFPDVEESISWEGHLSGFIAGLLLSWILDTPNYELIYKYDWQRPDYDPTTDRFMRCFDEQGNFVIKPKELPVVQPIVEPIVEPQPQPPTLFYTNYKVVYHYKTTNPEE